MKRWWRRVTEGGSGLIDGAVVHVLGHPKGGVVQPMERLLTARGPIASLAMPSEAWRFVAAASPPQDLGAAVLAGFDRVETVMKAHRPMIMPSYKDDLRALLGLGPRSALWKGMGLVDVSVAGAEIHVAPWRAEGAPGGFTQCKGVEPWCHGTSGIDCEALGNAVAQAMEISRAQS